MALIKGKQKEDKKVKNWYLDRYEFVVVQRNILALIAVLSLLATAASVFAVALLTKAKTFEPFIVEIEKKTGITSTINRSSIEQYAASEILRKYFIVKFVQAREAYDPADFQYNLYKVIKSMSSFDVYSAARNYFDPRTNEESPIKVFVPGEINVVKIKSVSFLDREKKKAQVRFAVERTNRDGKATVVNHRIAIVDFDINPNLNLQEEGRYINPLGFLVKTYRVDIDSDVVEEKKP